MKNKTTVEVRELARRLVEDPQYVDLLARRLKAGKAGPIEVVLWHYAYGKPNERLEIKNKDGPVVCLYLPDNGRGDTDGAVTP